MRYKLKVGVSTSPAAFILPRLQVELARDLPQLELEFAVADSATVRDQVLRRGVELGLVGRHFEHEDLRCEPFLEGDRLVVIVPPGWPLAGERGTIPLKRLRQERFIGRRKGSGTRAAYEPVLAAAGAPLSALNIVREAADTEACLEAVAAGEGVSIVSALAAREAVRSGRVRALELEALTLVRNLYLISHARVELSEAAAAFVELLRECRERCHHFPAGGGEPPRPEPRAGV